VIRFVPCSSQALVVATLRLLFNLSFDDEVRARMLNAGMCSKLVSLLKSPPLRARTLKLLYQLSVEDRCKAMFAFTDGIPLLVGMIINFPQDTLATELAALAVNMTLTDRNCEAMVANRGLNHMIDRLATTRDPLLFKIIRNISLWTHNIQQEMDDQDMGYRYRGLWSPHIKVLLEIVYSTDDHETLIEVYSNTATHTSSPSSGLILATTPSLLPTHPTLPSVITTTTPGLRHTSQPHTAGLASEPELGPVAA
jgi:hypothetical protein